MPENADAPAPAAIFCVSGRVAARVIPRACAGAHRRASAHSHPPLPQEACRERSVCCHEVERGVPRLFLLTVRRKTAIAG